MNPLLLIVSPLLLIILIGGVFQPDMSEADMDIHYIWMSSFLAVLLRYAFISG